MVIKITVKTLDSHDYQFEAQDDWTILQFKEHIQGTVNVASDQQRLIFCGRVLQNDKKLAEYDCDGKVMHLVRRPPPAIDNPDRESSNNNREQNTSDASPLTNDTHRMGDDANILLSAMTLGTDGNFTDLVRQFMSLQQAMYSRTFGSTFTTSSDSNRTDADIEGRLNNLCRLTNITVAQISEVNNRLNQISQPTAASRPIVTAASSHTDLPRDNSASVIDPDASTRRADSIANSRDDYRVASLVENIDGASRAQRRRLSLTTDDLPSATTRVTPNLGQTEPLTPTSGLRPGVPTLDRYLILLDRAHDLQGQVRTLTQRYRDILMVSRRGGLIVSDQASATNTARAQGSTETDSTNATGSESSSLPTSGVLMQEARILSSHLPRIMHSLSHIFHALSDFSVDVTNGSLNSLPQTAGLGAARRSSRRLNAQNSNQQDPRTADRRDRTPIVDSVTITATTVDTSHDTSTPSTTSGMQPQASATIVVTSEPGQAGVHIPIAIPIGSYNPHDIQLSFATPQVPPPTQESSRDPSASRSREPNQQSNSNEENPQRARRQETTSTQTSIPRPLGVISGRIPPPFDYYLMCCSPYASYQGPNQQGARQPSVLIPEARVQFSMPRMRYQVATESSAQQSQDGLSQSNPSLNAGLTQVVNNILESIFRPTDQPVAHSEAADQNRNQSSNQISQDPILNMIPELAINAASQILGGVFGIHTQQGQARTDVNDPQGSSRQRPRAQAPVMMDIDIDDSTDSQTTHHHDTHDTNRLPPAQQSTSHQQDLLDERPSPSTSNDHLSRHQTSSDQRISYNQRQLVEVLRNHSNWLPIIEADISYMERQLSDGSNSSLHFSDAYLSSIPRKRRRLLAATPDRVLILQSTPSQAIMNLLRRAVASSNVSSDVETLDSIFQSVANDTELQNAYEEHIKSAVETRLRSDNDFTPEKFENSNKYFNS